VSVCAIESAEQNSDVGISVDATADCNVSMTSMSVPHGGMAAALASFIGKREANVRLVASTVPPPVRAPLLRPQLPSITSRAASAAQPTKRGRRPRQMMSVLRPSVLSSSSVLQQAPVVVPQPMPVAVVTSAALIPPLFSNSDIINSHDAVQASDNILSAPGVIQIPANAQVMQTDDGMVIVCYPDGTIQIHGHREGQTIPLDAIRAVLGLNDSQHALVTIGDGQATTVDGGGMTAMQSIIGINNGAETTATVDSSQQMLFDINGGQPLMTIDGQTLMAVGGTNQSFISMDGTTLMALDPTSQTLVHIDPATQALMTVDGSQTLVAVDGSGHAVVTMDCGQFAGQMVVGDQYTALT
jgi:hypothetical protein